MKEKNSLYLPLRAIFVTSLSSHKPNLNSAGQTASRKFLDYLHRMKQNE